MQQWCPVAWSVNDKCVSQLWPGEAWVHGYTEVQNHCKEQDSGERKNSQ